MRQKEDLALFDCKMEVEQQPSVLSVDNLDMLENERFPKHGDLFPDSCRILFAGPSGCGKSNALLSLLLSPNGLRFKNIYIYSKSLYQPKYQLLEQVLKGVPEIGYHPYKENDDIIDPNDAEENSIIIFDDVVGDKQDKIKAYYSMGRHKAIDVAFLCQTYVMASKHLCRDNLNVIVLFKQDDTNLKHAFNEHVSPDMSYGEFKQLCAFCWNSTKYGFIVIVKNFDIDGGRYRQGFDRFIKKKFSQI
ncbi:uncharacterized protein LOC123320626 [Coccinella septempunctata]|uniref:uncharacterized protein LOC123320626 n=1 Tax=Coccinella septempunctata TaxID=41139 RepID=UPI001D07207E|nr:uncharacterized protein LOC123320626 [Coccinella septempunctata]